MPEVDWTPYAPGIRLYDPEDWNFMPLNTGAKYLTFPIHVTRRAPQPVKYALRQRLRLKLRDIAWRIIDWDED
jgi:hypothetical protein